jgi:hypothetical protein
MYLGLLLRVAGRIEKKGQGMLNFKWLMLNGLIKLGSLKINPDTNRESEGLLVIFNVEF